MAKSYKLDTVLAHIENRQQALSQVENNRQYIRVLRSLHYWLLQLADNYSDTAEYQAAFFTGAGWSLFTKVVFSIQDYNGGNRPF
jgi:uncharacterized protein YydD (DUF2326 family)